MAETIRLKDPDIEIPVRRRANARRLTLRIGPKGPVMTVPKYMGIREAQDFVAEKRDWLRERLDRAPALVAVGLGAEIPVEGRTVTLVGAKMRGCRMEEDILYVGGKPETAGRRVAAWLKGLAQERLEEAVDYYVREVRRPIGKMTLRDTKSRWGSCSTRGDLMFSWRLVMAPPAILDYVAAHEVAHRVEMNHSPAFWAEVERIMPEYREYRDWLRKEGAGLHRYRFG